MEELAVTARSGVPPPLPPKTRSKVSIPHDAPPAASTGATVFVSPAPTVSSQDAHSYSFPEVQGSNRTNHSQITTTTVHTNGGGHVVKIKINPENGEVKNSAANVTSSVVQLNLKNSETGSEGLSGDVVDSVTVPVGQNPVEGCIRINVGSSEADQLHRDEMIQRSTAMTESFIKTSVERPNPYFFYSAFPCATSTMVMSSGQCSPSDTLDSGTCSDLDSTPPPLPKKKSSGVTVTVISAQHKRASSLTSSGAEVDSDDNDSNISCDSLNSSELNALANEEKTTKCPSPPSMPTFIPSNINKASAFLPQGLLQDIRDRSAKLSQLEISTELDQTNTEELTVESTLQHTVTTESCLKAVIASPESAQKPIINESTYEDRKIEEKQKNNDQIETSVVKSGNYTYEADKYYKFHLNENVIEESKKEVAVKDTTDEELFAGYKDILGCNASSTIRSAKGTVRGVKNRVRAGIATFLQINSTNKDMLTLPVAMSTLPDQLHRDEMIQRSTAMTESFIKTSVERPNPYFFYSAFPCATSTMVMSSGQCSPSDTLDSGTCSDLDSTPPSLPKKKSSGVTVTVISAQHKQASSLTSSGADVDSDDNDSNISCDSLNSSELNALANEEKTTKCPSPPSMPTFIPSNNNKASAFLPQGLLQDIRDRSAKLSQLEISTELDQTNTEELTVESTLQYTVNTESCLKAVIASPESAQKPIINESTYEDRKIEEKQKNNDQIETSVVNSKNLLVCSLQEFT